MPSFFNKELVRESRWMRVYRMGEKHEYYESKFFADGLQVSADLIRSEWRTMTDEQKLEFALAFSAKPELQPGDEEILDHMMVLGSANVLSTIALLTVKHPDKEKAFSFLTDQIQKGNKPLVNFYQALELLNDHRAVPMLRRAYDHYKMSLAAGDSVDFVDYLRCCRALLNIAGGSEYAESIRDMRSHSSEHVSRMAKRLLEGKT